jgi:hypothetical protein
MFVEGDPHDASPPMKANPNNLLTNANFMRTSGKDPLDPTIVKGILNNRKPSEKYRNLKP